ncbi:MAG TPA: TIGR02186 family protein [Pararhizobium sp.]|nr:TIGR02186 family protein [Pararhizobium sp.]
MRRLVEISVVLMVLAACLLSAAAEAAPPKEELEIGVSTSEIAVRSNFSGADITVFGVIKHADPFTLALNQYDLIVTLEGPKLETTVRKKQRVFGIWMNRHSVEFLPIPTSYSQSSTRPIDLISTQPVLDRLAVGIKHLRLPTASVSGSAADTGEFREALLRLKEQDGLYRSDSGGVQFVGSTLFKASIRLPANIPVGTHIVHGYLFKNGRFVADEELPLHVVKTGVEQYIYAMAHQYGFLYGLFAVLLAGLAGWLGSLIFRD